MSFGQYAFGTGTERDYMASTAPGVFNLGGIGGDGLGENEGEEELEIEFSPEGEQPIPVYQPYAPPSTSLGTIPSQFNASTQNPERLYTPQSFGGPQPGYTAFDIGSVTTVAPGLNPQNTPYSGPGSSVGAFGGPSTGVGSGLGAFGGTTIAPVPSASLSISASATPSLSITPSTTVSYRPSAPRTTGSMFGGTTSSTFGGTAQIGGPTPSTGGGMFGGTTPVGGVGGVFGSFASSQPAQPTPSVVGVGASATGGMFGGTSGGGMFGGSMPSPSRTTMAPSSSSVPFGQPSPQPQGLPSSTPFGAAPSSTPFGQQQGLSSSSSTPFGSSQSFSQPQGATTPFGQPQGGSTPFGQPQGATTTFGQSQGVTTTPFGQPQSAYGAAGYGAGGYGVGGIPSQAPLSSMPIGQSYAVTGTSSQLSNITAPVEASAFSSTIQGAAQGTTIAAETEKMFRERGFIPETLTDEAIAEIERLGFAEEEMAERGGQAGYTIPKFRKRPIIRKKKFQPKVPTAPAKRTTAEGAGHMPAGGIPVVSIPDIAAVVMPALAPTYPNLGSRISVTPDPLTGPAQIPQSSALLQHLQMPRPVVTGEIDISSSYVGEQYIAMPGQIDMNKFALTRSGVKGGYTVPELRELIEKHGEIPVRQGGKESLVRQLEAIIAEENATQQQEREIQLP